MILFIYYTPLFLVFNLWSVEGSCKNYGNSQYKELEVAVPFQTSRITPDIVPVAPEGELIVSYETADAQLGNKIFPVRTLEPPAIAFDAANATLIYTLLILDVDQPSKTAPRLRSSIKLLYVNIPGETLLPPPSLDYLNSGYPVALFVPAAIVPGSGIHRIVALLYEQTEPIDTTNYDLLYLGVYRYEFNLTAFIANYTLVPAAGNFYTTDFPENYALYCLTPNQGIYCK